MNKDIIKELTSISLNITEPEYRSLKAYSYSLLAKFNREGFDNLATLFDKVESPSLRFGSLVDTLLTGTKKEFEDNFLVAEFPIIPESQMNIIKILFDRFSDSTPQLQNIKDEDILDVILQQEYQPRWLPATRIKAIREAGNEYYNLLFLSVGKTIINTSEYNTALQCVNSLKGSNNTKDLFNPNNPFSSIQKYYQLKFKGIFEGIDLKCMSDLLVVDYENKVITPYDLKTSYKPEWDFYKSFIEWGYWIQAALYWNIIRQNLDKDGYFKDFKLENYKFIIISKNTLVPLVWEYIDTKSEVDMVYGKHNQILCRNWRNIVGELDYYLKNIPKVPLGIEQLKPNDLILWLNKM